MIRRFVLAVAVLTGGYALVWQIAPESTERRIEGEAVRLAITAAFATYAVLAVAFWRARKTRLNAALAVNKATWAVLIGVLFLHRLWFDSGWQAPGSVRVYLWSALALTTIGVLYEFWRANWGSRSGDAR